MINMLAPPTPFATRETWERHLFQSDVLPTMVGPPRSTGRPPGVPNKLTRIIKEAILLAIPVARRRGDRIRAYLAAVAHSRICTKCECVIVLLMAALE